RIEHLTMPTRESLHLYAELGLVASVQPSFDAHWGGAGGMYEHRLGSDRLANSHPFGAMSQSGLALAFGSDSPVTFGSPWTWIQAATEHNQVAQRLSTRAAFAAATRGGRRAAKQDSRGVLAVGAPADLAIWQVPAYEDLTTQHDESSSVQNRANITNWSTDPRSGTHPLPDLRQGLPTCLATIRDGQFIFDGLGVTA
ncbi:MAG: amidohydrolase family protein, partial [Actinomycetales bacterium]|nr:amidohydrolase family protein [Actinomycetales bacterium]